MSEDGPIRLTIALPPRRLQQASNLIVGRHMGPWRRVLIMVIAPLTGALLVSLAAGWLLGVAPALAALLAFYASAGALAGLLVARHFAARRYLDALETSGFRALPVPVVLDGAGIGFAARALPWSAVSGTARWQDCTLIHFSAADALVVPDAALPPGLTAHGLAERIAAWKAA